MSLHRFGFGDSSESHKDPEDEVNEYLMRAIDARSIDHLRAEHCQSLLLCFKSDALERKVSAQYPGTSVTLALIPCATQL